MSATIGRDADSGQPLTIGDTERRSGLYVLGKPGMGKSALLVNLILQDRENGHGVFFLDPHGDAISDCVRRKGIFGQGGILDGYIFDDRCIFLDPEDETYSFGINPLFCPDITSLKERVA